MKVMLEGWDQQFPGRLESIFSGLQNIAPSQLMDSNLFDFMGLTLNETNETTSKASNIDNEQTGLDILEL